MWFNTPLPPHAPDGYGTRQGHGGGTSPLLRVRAAILPSAAVAGLSVVTGIANIGSTAVPRPIAPHVPPDIGGVIGFTGALTGLLMLVSVAGLRRGLRVAWLSTLVLLPVTAVQGLAETRALPVPGLGVAVAVSLPLWCSRCWRSRRCC